MTINNHWTVSRCAVAFFAILFLTGAPLHAATPIASGETQCGTLDISESMAYEFFGEAGDRVVIDAAKTGGNFYFNTELRLIDPDLMDEEHTQPGGDLLDHTLQKSGVYTIIVQDVDLDHPGSYCLTFINLVTGPIFTSDDPDGGNIASGETSCGDNVASDMDAYQFYGEAGDRVLISAAKSGGNFYYNTEMRLIDPDFEDAADSQPGGDLLDHTLQKTGVYTVIVQDVDLDHPGSYCISLVNLMGAASSPGDCDNGLLLSGTPLSGANAISDMDVYPFYGAAGDRVIIGAAKTGGNFYYNTEILLIDPDKQDEADTLPGGDLLDHILLKTGLYMIVVQDVGFDHAGTYNITLNKLPGTPTTGIYSPYPATDCNQPTDVTLTWDPVANATGYDVYLGADALAPMVRVGINVQDSTWSVADLEPETVYHWKVIAQTPTGEVQGTVNWFITEMMCDLNHDCSCNILDWPIFTEDWGRRDCNEADAACACDLNEDGSCNILDWPFFIKNWGMTICQ